MLSGHLCRCTGYTPIVAAILEVAQARAVARALNTAKASHV
jgi:2-furoyl-CoA dehydrogenase 2Fe-2S iron sulfur subunit